MRISLNSSRFFLVLLQIQLVVGVQDKIESDDGLIFAHILFRHGDRNIEVTYPTDPYKNESFWKGGFGGLTNIGKQQLFELGAYLRKRYFSLIGNNGSYQRDKIYVQSTDVDRTLMSASLNMAGMFPPADDQVWNENLLWQAVPIHTIPSEFDGVLNGRRPCPLHDQAYNEYLASDELKFVMEKHQSLFRYLEKHAGWTKIQSLNQATIVYRALWVESLHGFTLPEWTKKIFYPGSELEQLAIFNFSLPTSTKLLVRLKQGFLLRDILDRFTMKVNAKLSPDRSLWIYSGHDMTIIGILNALGLLKPHIPNYASCLFFELHRFNGRYHVEIFYKHNNGEDKEALEPLFIPQCGRKCPLNRFYEIYKEVLPTKDFESECRIDNALSDVKNTVSSAAHSQLRTTHNYFQTLTLMNVSFSGFFPTSWFVAVLFVILL